MTTNPKVSVICPLFNKKEYIKETIDSVLNQIYKNWELIIVDDGSSDGSYEYTASLVQEIPGVYLYKREEYSKNKGGSVCRNIGLKLSTGTFIMFLDADDVLYPYCLQSRVEYAALYPGYSMFIFNENYFIDAPVTLSQKPVELKSHPAPTKEFFLKRFLTYQLPWTIANVLWAKELLLSLNGFEESFQRLQDPELHTRALLSDHSEVKYLKHILHPDVAIRIDKNPKGLGNQKTLPFFNSVKHYISFFSQYLEDTGNAQYRKYLAAYLFAMEMRMILYSQSDSSNKEKYEQLLKSTYRDGQFQRLRNRSYAIFMGLYSSSARIKPLRMIKLHAIAYRIYTRTI